MRLSTKLAVAMSLVAGILHFSVRSAAADQLGFAVDATGSLYTVDLTTAAATRIGSTGQLLEGLAISPQGSLFGTDLFGNLFSVSKTTGAATLIGNAGVGDIEGLSFLGATLLGTDFSNTGGPTTIYVIDTTTAAPTPIISFPQGPVRALASMNTNRLELASDTPVYQSLVQVNLLNGISTPWGSCPVRVRILSRRSTSAATGSSMLSVLTETNTSSVVMERALWSAIPAASTGSISRWPRPPFPAPCPSLAAWHCF